MLQLQTSRTARKTSDKTGWGRWRHRLCGQLLHVNQSTVDSLFSLFLLFINKYGIIAMMCLLIVVFLHFESYKTQVIWMYLKVPKKKKTLNNILTTSALVCANQPCNGLGCHVDKKHLIPHSLSQ